MMQFLRKHPLNILFVIALIVDGIAMPRYPSICGITTGVIAFCAVMDHKRQEEKMRQNNSENR
jgi:hypothetical protein